MHLGFMLGRWLRVCSLFLFCYSVLFCFALFCSIFSRGKGGVLGRFLMERKIEKMRETRGAGIVCRQGCPLEPPRGWWRTAGSDRMEGRKEGVWSGFSLLSLLLRRVFRHIHTCTKMMTSHGRWFCVCSIGLFWWLLLVATSVCACRGFSRKYFFFPPSPGVV